MRGAAEPPKVTIPDWVIRGTPRRQACGPPGLEHPWSCGPKPRTGTAGEEGELPRTGIGAAQEGCWTADLKNLSAADTRTQPQGMEDPQGRASQHEMIWGTGDKIEDRATPSEEKGMKTKTRGKNMGQKRGPDNVSQAQQEGEDTPQEGSAGGESHTPQTGWNIRSKAKKHDSGPVDWTFRRATGCIVPERSRRREGGPCEREHRGGSSTQRRNGPSGEEGEQPQAGVSWSRGSRQPAQGHIQGRQVTRIRTRAEGPERQNRVRTSGMEEWLGKGQPGRT